jgi:HEPN domain-containing protein
MTASARPDEARQLLAAAARDRQALVILSRDPQAPAEIALFLAQQALEKCIKAVLAMKGLVYRRTHDLLLLESLASEAGLTLPVGHDLLARIGPYAVEFRYLGTAAPAVSLVDALGAVDAAMSWSAAIVDTIV